MPANFKTVVRASRNGFPVEFEIAEDASLEEVSEFIDNLPNRGYKEPIAFGKPRENLEGKKGTVTGIEAIPDSKMFNVVIKLDDGGEHKVKAFSKNEFRKDDYVVLARNDKGFINAELADRDAQTQKVIPF